MSLIHLAKYALTLPPHVAAAKAMRYGARIVGAKVDQVRLKHRCTFVEPDTAGDLPSYVPEIPANRLAPRAEDIRALTERYLEHRFDLLGSGWVRVEHGINCAGFAGVRFPPTAPPADRDLAGLVSPGNRVRSQAIRGLIAPDYAPIDWQIDFKSGYRWSEAQAHGTVAYGHKPGVDVKVPWELGRLQHLPQLALAFVLAKAGEAEFETPDRYRDEFRNQVLDFLAANPPGFGVQWACPMDISIRAANLCLAFDLFRRHGAQFDRAFTDELIAGLLAHGRHVTTNLEWHDDHRANHYLADITGLAFIAAYLPRGPEADVWLAFAIRELALEIPRQFWPDGSNFEASTSYHRLSTEMAVYATALIRGLPDFRLAALRDYDHTLLQAPRPLPAAPLVVPFGDGHGGPLARMAEFTVHITKPNGRIAQIGDNDSGRFVKLLPAIDENLTEDQLDHRSVVAAVNGLYGRDDFAAFAGPGWAAETALVEGLAQKRFLDGGTAWVAVGRTVAAEGVACGPSQSVITLPDPTVLDDIQAIAYPDFGLYLWRGPRVFLSVRCGPIGQGGNGGHAHNDQLAVELNVDGEDWLADPGTGVYTPDPGMRDSYRSVLAHATPRDGTREPARLDLGLFRLEDRARARCFRFDSEMFVGAHYGFGEATQRAVYIEPDAGRIVIRDTGPDAIVEIGKPETLRAHFRVSTPFSPGYGLVDTD